jgi:EmrB/QacA subfamily drug resistance transporter
MRGRSERAGRARPVSRRGTLAATVMAAGIVQLPTAAIVVAIPTIHTEFGASIAELQWTVTAFYIPFSALLITSGRLADIFGRRRAFLAGAALFAGGSLVAALAPGVGVLIAGIALSGAGGALLMPSSMAILTNVFTSDGRGVAIGMWGAATELISGVGVVVGGILTGELDWRWIFVVNIVVAAVMVLLALRGSPESRDPTAPRTIDASGVALTAGGLVTLTLALIQGPTWGWGSTATIALLVAAAASFAAFAVVERRSEHPLVDFGFFRHRNFSGSMVVIFVMDFSFGALLFFLPLYFQELLGYSPLEAGVLLLPLTGLMVIASPLGGRVAARTGPRLPIVVGLASMAVAIYLISRLSLDTDYADLWGPTALMGFGVGFALTPMNLAAMNAIPRDHHGAASGLLVTLSGLGATLGVAVTGALFQALQTDRTVSLAGESGVTITEEQALELEGLLAGTPGAQNALDRIAGGKAAGIDQAVREAFVDALGTSLIVSAGLVVLGLILAVVLMRRSTPADAEPTPPILAPPSPRPAPRRATV